jgi:hypothetical protein
MGFVGFTRIVMIRWVATVVPFHSQFTAPL